jgi:N-acetylneuraminic acid mutarotase
MSAARFGETLTSLADGRVLAAGGIGPDGRSLASAEVFDPARAAWTAVPTGMASPRSGAAAVALSDGRVLVIGGIDTAQGEGRVLASAELFDPVADVFTATGSLHEARQDFTATRLRDGRVLVAGGANASASLSGAELFDPAVGTWARTGSMSGGRRLHGASLLANGNVLVTGGEAVREGARSALTTAEIYVTSSGSWRPARPMACPRSAAAQVTLLNGTVLVAGGDAALPGQPPQAQSCSELFVPTAR